MRTPCNRKHLSVVISSILVTSTLVMSGCDSASDASGLYAAPTYSLKRIATAPLDAEFTGMFLNTDGTFFLNVQHPSATNLTAYNGKTFDKGTIGTIVGTDFRDLGAVEGLEAPSDPEDQEIVKTAVGSYQIISQQGDTLQDGKKMGDIIAADGATLLKNSNDPDFNAAVTDGAGGFYLYTNWEDRPGGMSRVHISGLNGTAGYSSIIQEGMLDFSSVRGTWVNCFGTLSPWGTPMSAEELYFDDTADWYNKDYQYFSNAQAVAAYLGYNSDPATATSWGNPYDYGYIVEIGTENTATANNISDIKVNKLELLGRFSHENSVTMPDNRTVFLSDDGTGTVLFKFVADRAQDMSSGTLYAAKVTQNTAVGSKASETTFDVSWVKLGAGIESTIEAAIRDFDGVFAEAKHITQEQIDAYAAGNNPFADDRIAFFESRKVAAAMGATAEFRKMEGVITNPTRANDWWNNSSADGAQAYMYLAMSSFDKTMSDDDGDIQLDSTDGKCGVVYKMALGKNDEGLVDITDMKPIVVGGPYDSNAPVNQCAYDNISNPDNLAVLNDGRLLIGEDTGSHQNNMIWLYEAE